MMTTLSHQFAAAFQRMLDKYAESGITLDLKQVRIYPELRLYGNLPACYYLSAQHIQTARYVVIGAKHAKDLPIPFDSRLNEGDAVSDNLAEIFALAPGANTVLERAYENGVHLLNLVPFKLYHGNTPLNITVVKPWYDFLIAYLETIRLQSPDVRYIVVGSRLKSYLQKKLPKSISDRTFYLSLPKDVASAQKWQVLFNFGA